MKNNRLKAEARVTSRRPELELLKALAIISMILCHPVIRLGVHNPGYENEFLFFLGKEIFGKYLCVAHAFMFAMGFGMIFMHKNEPKDLMRRGLKIYLLGYVLNFFRYGIYNLAEGVFTGEFRSDMLEAMFGMDILQFAGLALIITGVLKILKLREVHILAISGILSVIGSVIPFIDTGNYAGNWLLGHFVFTKFDACGFPFFNWYIFVATGMFFGSLLHRTENPDHIYKRLLIISCSVMVVYIVLTFCFGVFFLCRDHQYDATSLAEAAGLLSIDLSLLSAFYFLLKRVPASKFRVFLDMSRSITPIYFIHWCIIGFVDSIFCYLFEISFPWPVIYLFGVILILLSGLFAVLRSKRKQKAKAQ